VRSATLAYIEGCLRTKALSDPIPIIGAGSFVGMHLVCNHIPVIAVHHQPTDPHMANVEIVIGEPNEPEHCRPLQRPYDTGCTVDVLRVVMDANLARQHCG